jgi:hypothetical protein
LDQKLRLSLGKDRVVTGQRIDQTYCPFGRMTDALAIGVAWFCFIVVIFYPASQLAAIVLYGVFRCVRKYELLSAEPIIAALRALRGPAVLSSQIKLMLAVQSPLQK